MPKKTQYNARLDPRAIAALKEIAGAHGVPAAAVLEALIFHLAGNHELLGACPAAARDLVAGGGAGGDGDIAQAIADLDLRLAALESRAAPPPPAPPPPAPPPPAPPPPALTLAEVCRAIGLSAKNLARTAKNAGYPDRDSFLAGEHGFRVAGVAGRSILYARDQ